jgi:hypothetical protein
MITPHGPLGPTVAIVLGAGIEPGGKASTRSRARAEAAARLAQAIPEMSIIVTGDGRKNSIERHTRLSEASCMARILIENGISRKRIFREHQAVDTAGNAVLSAARFLAGKKPRHVYVVTSPFHAERALIYFRGVLGPECVVEPWLCEKVPDDDRKGSLESGGIDWARRFFDTTIPGNICSMVDRLLTIGKPRYRRLIWLKHLRTAA